MGGEIWTGSWNSASDFESDLFLQAGGLEGEQELLHVVFAELVNTASINGTSQKLIHLVLRVQRLLSTTAVFVSRRTVTIVPFAFFFPNCIYSQKDKTKHSLVFAGCFINALSEEKEQM